MTRVKDNEYRASRPSEAADRAPVTSRALAGIWGSWLFLVLVLSLLRGSSFGSTQVNSEFAVLVHTTTAAILLITLCQRPIALLLGASLSLRTALVFWDTYFRNAFVLPGSGADSEMFYFWALRVAEEPSLIYAELPGDIYSKMYGLLFHLMGPERLFAQYTNALMGLTLVIVVYRILQELGVDESGRFRTLALAAFFPNALILSSLFLRESIIALLVAVSILYFQRWMLLGGLPRLLTSIALVLGASLFHSGVAPILLAYMIVAVLYRREAGTYGFTLQSIPYLAIFMGVVALLAIQYPDLFLGKFRTFETEADLLVILNRREGGSTYLTDMPVNTVNDLVTLGPVRAAFFLASPVPWNWRNITDILTFLLDSLFYMTVLGATLRNARRLGEFRSVGFALLAVVIISTFVFGLGVSNAGTALRHRYKLFAVFLVLAGVVLNVARARGRQQLVRRRTSLAKLEECHAA